MSYVSDWCVKQNDTKDNCTAPIINGVPLCHHDQMQGKPTPNTALAGHSMAYPPAVSPKPVSRPRKERSAPVRNPAFRENEALRELQKQLNSRR